MEHTLPTLAELHEENPDAWKVDRFKILVNQLPPASWVKKNQFANNTSYVPIEKIEYLLDRICGNWAVEIKSIMPVFNSVVAIVRLHYYNPATKKMEFHDGTGAVPVQTNSGASAADIGAIKSNAVQLAAPAAVSYAIKDAAEHIGAIFGRNISRKDTLPFTPAFSEDPYKGEQAQIVAPPPPPIPQHVTAPAVSVDFATPKFEADFFAPVEPSDLPENSDLDAPIDF